MPSQQTIARAFALLFLLWAAGLWFDAGPARAQEQIDLADAPRAGKEPAAPMAIRVRVSKCLPEQKEIVVRWRYGGEGLGGKTVRGEFAAEKSRPGAPPPLRPGEWTAWLPLETVAGRGHHWAFPAITVDSPKVGRKKADPPHEIAVDFEVAQKGSVFKRFTETAPKGATVSFAFPGVDLDEGGTANPAFVAALQGISGHAHDRYNRLVQKFGDTPPVLRHFAVLGHLAGYGEASAGAGKHGAAGYGVHHCNPAIVADECRTMRMLGMNGLVGGGSLELADAAGTGEQFRHLFWGGPGSASPMGYVADKRKGEEGCPFDPALAPRMAETVEWVIEEDRATKAKASWALWWDEIGVAAKQHIAHCPTCRKAFCAYLRRQGVTPQDLAAASWDNVKPYDLFPSNQPSGGGKAARKATQNPPPVPTETAEALRYYYTYRFMTIATANLFAESAKKFQKAGIPLYAMQGPTPSWGGASLDWHEFYDMGANTALVWETSNRDPRVWQWESYLGDIMRGIAARHTYPIGSLVKPHRGAPPQRMLSVVSRGAEVIEWYTYGPDYAKGDSFSQSSELLEQVAWSGRFLAQAEDYLYHARWARQSEVAFVAPRSSEIWGHAILGNTAFEDAKWVYLALAHAHVPVDILSEQQLAEGKLARYKVLYVVGPNLRRDAAAKVAEFVHGGGTLWTDALGLARDEANQPATALGDLFPGARQLQPWGTVPAYKAAALQSLDETTIPASATVAWNAGGAWGQGKIQARMGREPLEAGGGEIIARFADGKAAVVRRQCGRGEVIQAGLWAGLSYSAQVRREDYNMQRDFDPAIRALVAAPALSRGVYRPVLPAEPLVEGVLLEKDGKRSIALMNWAYCRTENPTTRRGETLQVHKNLRIALPGVENIHAVRSLLYGALPLAGTGADRGVVLPELGAIDLLIVE